MFAMPQTRPYERIMEAVEHRLTASTEELVMFIPDLADNARVVKCSVRVFSVRRSEHSKGAKDSPTSEVRIPWDRRASSVDVHLRRPRRTGFSTHGCATRPFSTLTKIFRREDETTYARNLPGAYTSGRNPSRRGRRPCLRARPFRPRATPGLRVPSARQRQPAQRRLLDRLRHALLAGRPSHRPPHLHAQARAAIDLLDFLHRQACAFQSAIVRDRTCSAAARSSSARADVRPRPARPWATAHLVARAASFMLRRQPWSFQIDERPPRNARALGPPCCIPSMRSSAASLSHRYRPVADDRNCDRPRRRPALRSSSRQSRRPDGRPASQRPHARRPHRCCRPPPPPVSFTRSTGNGRLHRSSSARRRWRCFSPRSRRARARPGRGPRRAATLSPAPPASCTVADSRASFPDRRRAPAAQPSRERCSSGRAVLQAGKNKLTRKSMRSSVVHSLLIEDTRFVQAGLRTESASSSATATTQATCSRSSSARARRISPT